MKALWTLTVSGATFTTTSLRGAASTTTTTLIQTACVVRVVAVLLRAQLRAQLQVQAQPQLRAQLRAQLQLRAQRLPSSTVTLILRRAASFTRRIMIGPGSPARPRRRPRDRAQM